MSFTAISRIDYQLYLAIRYIITLLESETGHARKEAHRLRDENSKAYNPSQPRVPAGNRDGGEWTRTGGGSGLSAPLPRRKPGQLAAGRDNWWDTGRGKTPPNPAQPPAGLPPDLRDSLKPLYPRLPLGDYLAEGFQAEITPQSVALTVGAIAAPEAIAVTRLLAGVPAARLFFSGLQQEQRILKAAQTIEKFLGGKPDFVRLKETGDFVMIRGDLQIRFDMFKFGSFKGARPHFQIQRRIIIRTKEAWEDVAEHWFISKTRSTT